MSASMAEVLKAHWSASTHTDKKPFVDKCDGCGAVILTWGTNGDLTELIAAHQAEQLAANGYGKLEDAWDEGAYAYETRRARDESLPLTNPYQKEPE